MVGLDVDSAFQCSVEAEQCAHLKFTSQIYTGKCMLYLNFDTGHFPESACFTLSCLALCLCS